LTLACLLIGAPAAHAGALDITRFHARQGPRNLTVGPDGNLYYSSSSGDVGRMTLDGQLTMINVPEDSTTEAIAAGPDGNVWYIPQYSDYVGKITPAGVVTTYPLPRSTYPNDITAGPDGAMWFTQPYPESAPSIGRITTDGVITTYPIPTPYSRPTSITAGPDGNLWFTEPDVGKVGRISPLGDVTEFSGGDAVSPDHIAAARDGKLWFADIYYGDVYTITTDGQVSPSSIPVPSSYDKGIEALVATPADTMWLAGRWGYLASIDRSRQVTEYRVRDQSIDDLVLAPGGDLWFSNGSTYDLGRVDRSWNASCRWTPASFRA
jgi:virginiamycin B lyase